MTVVNVRIDERLIHGQVATMWTNQLKANRIMVVNDAVAQDKVQKMALKMAVPGNVALSVLSIETAALNMVAGKYDNQRLFIILKNPEDGLRLIEKGAPIKEINVGNMSHREGNIQIKKTVSVTKENIQTFRILDKNGIKLFAQMVPNDAIEDVITLINKSESGK